MSVPKLTEGHPNTPFAYTSYRAPYLPADAKLLDPGCHICFSVLFDPSSIPILISSQTYLPLSTTISASFYGNHIAFHGNYLAFVAHLRHRVRINKSSAALIMAKTQPNSGMYFQGEAKTFPILAHIQILLLVARNKKIIPILAPIVWENNGTNSRTPPYNSINNHYPYNGIFICYSNNDT